MSAHVWKEKKTAHPARRKNWFAIPISEECQSDVRLLLRKLNANHLDYPLT